MSRKPFELLEYQHQELMNDLNEFMIRVKMHVFDLPVKLPLLDRLMEVLKADAKPIRH